MAVFSLAAGYVGWRRASKPVYRRSYAGVDVPDGMTRREYDRAVRRRAKRWRLFMTAVYALSGGATGLLLLFVLARH
jgi:hypothetical protein